MRLIRSVITLSFCCHSFVAHLQSHHAATSLLLQHVTFSSFIRLPVRSMLITFHQHSFSSLLTGVPCAGVVLFFLPAFFSLVTSNWTQDLQTLPYVPSISVLSSTHAIQPLCLMAWVHISKKMQWYDKCKCEIHYGVSIIVYITLVVLMGCLFFALANPLKTTHIVWCISA